MDEWVSILVGLCLTGIGVGVVIWGYRNFIADDPEQSRYSWEREDDAEVGCGCVFLIVWIFGVGVVSKIWGKIGDYFDWDKDDRSSYVFWFIGVIIVVVVLWILAPRIKRWLGIR